MSEMTRKELKAEVERLRAEVETTTGAWSRMRALHQSCESKLATARAALEPFAHVADLCEKSRVPKQAFLWSRSSNVPGEPQTEGISVTDVMNARKALEEIK